MNFDNFFSNFDTSDSYAIMFITIIGFLFGLIIGLLLRGAKTRAFKKQLKAQTAINKELETEKITLEGSLHQTKAALTNNQSALRQQIEHTKILDAENKKALADIQNHIQAIEQLQASNQSYFSTIDDLNNQIIGLNTKNEQLLNEINQQQTFAATPVDDQTLNRLELVEQQLQTMAAQNQELKELLNNINNQKTFENSNTEEPSIEELSPKEKNILKGKFIERPSQVDDLTKINGLGAFTAKKLNEIGIFTYEQIAGWGDDMVEHITKEIEFIPGRIQKDKWVEQAAQLQKNKKTKLPKKYQDPTNLKIIEGIGPKIEQLFKADGINNWTELSASSIKRLKGILEKAGKRFQMHDPTTWSKQATLAANGKWDELEKYQAELNGGR